MARDSAQATLDVLVESRRLWEEARDYRREWDEKMREELPFALEGDRYLDSAGNTKGRIQPVGRELPSKLRHMEAQITKDLYLEVRPATPLDDPTLAEVAKHVLTHETGNKRKFYKTYRKNVCMLRLAARLGVGAMDFCHEAGEIVFRTVAPDCFHWTPGWQNPHEIDCPDVFEAKRMSRSAVEKLAKTGWKDTQGLTGDSGEGDSRNIADPSLAPGQVSFSGGGIPSGRPTSTPLDPILTVVLRWSRYSDETYDRPSNRGPELLTPERRYMACPACGYQEPPPNGDGSQLPEWGGICQACAAKGLPNVMERIDAERPTDKVLKYPKGRLVIFAPYQNRVFYDGKWPWAMRSVPYFVYKSNHPLNPVGDSETSLDWSMQLLADSAKRFGYEQMMGSRRLFGIVDAGGNNTILNAHGQPFMLADEDGYIFYAKSIEMLEHGIREFQGAGLPPAWGLWNNTIQNELLRDMGTGDRSLTGPDLKNVAPGTINATIETGEIPVDEKREDFQEAEGLALGVLLDMCAATYTDERVIAAVGKDGVDEFLRLRGVDIPEVHVDVTASPQMKQTAVGEAQEMLTVIKAEPPYRRFLARQYNVSPTDLAQLEQDEAEWMAQQREDQIEMQAEAIRRAQMNPTPKQPAQPTQPTQPQRPTRPQMNGASNGSTPLQMMR